MRGTPLFLLDTNVVSVLGKPSPDPRVVSWIGAAPAGSLAVSWSTVFEMQFGVEKARMAGSTRAAHYERSLADLLADRRFRVLLPSTEAARIRARMHATPELRNFVRADPGARRQPTGEDLTIAATAIAAGAAIVTGNLRDFASIGRHFELPGLLDPASGEWVVPPARGTPRPTARAEGTGANPFRSRSLRTPAPWWRKPSWPDGGAAPASAPI